MSADKRKEEAEKKAAAAAAIKAKTPAVAMLRGARMAVGGTKVGSQS